MTPTMTPAPSPAARQAMRELAARGTPSMLTLSESVVVLLDALEAVERERDRLWHALETCLTWMDHEGEHAARCHERAAGPALDVCDCGYWAAIRGARSALEGHGDG